MFSPASAPSRGTLESDRVGIVDRLLESIRQQPGIAAAGTITNIPLSGDSGKTAITPKGYVPPPGQSVHGHYSYGVNGDYFTALGIPLREGRFLTSADSHRPERVCVVDEDLARRYWPKAAGARPAGVSWQRIGGSEALHHCRRCRRGKTNGAHGGAGAGGGLPALRSSRRRQHFRRRAHEPASGSVRRDAAQAGPRNRSRDRDR